MNNANAYLQAFHYASGWETESFRAAADRGLPRVHHHEEGNRLLEYFRKNTTGPGIWKWEHYFDVYQRHFAKFVNHPVDILEIGVYSGGSLNMWRSYFGEQARVFGVDIEPACKAYERDGISIMIGNQEDRGFWRTFKSEVPALDVLIDDGGHTDRQQIVTLEEMLPHIRPGGVYLCEDVFGLHHQMVSFASGLVSELNRTTGGGILSAFQKCVYSIHLYPYLLVVEKQASTPARFRAPRFGTEWQPFFNRKAASNLMSTASPRST